MMMKSCYSPMCSLPMSMSSMSMTAALHHNHIYPINRFIFTPYGEHHERT